MTKTYRLYRTFFHNISFESFADIDQEGNVIALFTQYETSNGGKSEEFLHNERWHLFDDALGYHRSSASYQAEMTFKLSSDIELKIVTDRLIRDSQF